LLHRGLRRRRRLSSAVPSDAIGEHRRPGAPAQIVRENNSMKRNTGHAIASLMLAMGFSAFLPAQHADRALKSDLIEPEAKQALNKMGTYLRSLKDFEVRADITTEDVLTDGEKLQYAQTATLLARLPDKLRGEVDGEQKSRVFLYDGKSFTLFARRLGYYATVPAPSTVGQLIDVVNEKYKIEMPVVDLFLWGSPRAIADEITAASDIGPGEIEGVTCEHYAFRQPGMDWQVWIQLGDHPLPRKLVLTTTTDEARPQHTSVLTWNLAPSYNAESFVFHPPADAHKIVFAEDVVAKDTPAAKHH
jgi:hypothetical protein